MWDGLIFSSPLLCDVHQVEIILVERVQQTLGAGVWPWGVADRADAELGKLTDVPILPVGHIPELNRIAWIEASLGHGGWVEVPFAHDPRATDTLRPER